jgi:hypothetical protein
VQGLSLIASSKTAFGPFFIHDAITLAGLACLFAGWNMPNHYPPLPSFHGELATALGIVLLLLAVAWPSSNFAPASPMNGGAAKARRVLPFSASSRICLALALLPSLQYAAGMLFFRGDAALALLYGGGLALGLYVGYLWAAQLGAERVLKMLFVTIVLGGVVANAFALAQWLRLGAISWWAVELIDERPFANFAQPNHYGLMMVVSIVAVTALYEMRVLRHRFSYALALAFFGWGELISQSRASSLALLSVALCWLLTRRRAPTRLQTNEVILALVIWCLLYLQLEAIQNALYGNEASIKSLEIGTRQWMWPRFLAALMDHPWLGYGFNQGGVALADAAARTPSPVTTATTYAHNFLLDLMIWAGIPIGVGIVVALLAWMRTWLKSGSDGKTQAQHCWVFAFWLALLVQSMFEYPYAYAYFLLPAALLAGAITPLPSRPPSQGTVTYRPGGVVILPAGLLVALLAAVTWDYWAIEDDYREVRFTRLNFVDQPKHDFQRKPLVLDQIASVAKTALFKLKPDMPADEIAALHATARRFQSISTQIDYAKALALNGQSALAEQELEIVRSNYSPANYVAIRNEWQAWLSEKRLKSP